MKTVFGLPLVHNLEQISKPLFSLPLRSSLRVQTVFFDCQLAFEFPRKSQKELYSFFLNGFLGPEFSLDGSAYVRFIVNQVDRHLDWSSIEQVIIWYGVIDWAGPHLGVN